MHSTREGALSHYRHVTVFGALNSLNVLLWQCVIATTATACASTIYRELAHLQICARKLLNGCFPRYAVLFECFLGGMSKLVSSSPSPGNEKEINAQRCICYGLRVCVCAVSVHV